MDDGSRLEALLSLVVDLTQNHQLPEQREQIIRTLGAMFGGTVELLFSEAVYRLPGHGEGHLYNPSSALPLMRRAYEDKRLITDGPGYRGSQGSEQRVSLAAPLIKDQSVLGVIQIERVDGPEFSQAEMQFIERACADLSTVLFVTHQVAIKNWRLEQLSLVRSVSSQLANICDIDELSKRITTLIQETYHYYYICIYTVETGLDVLRLRASSLTGSHAPVVDHGQPVLVHSGEGMIGYVATSGEELIAPDVDCEPHYRRIDSLPETQSEFTLPITIENQVLGILDVQSDIPNSFHEIDMLVLRALADNIASAMRNAILCGDLRKRADQLSTLAEVSRSISSILDLDQVYQEVVSVLHERFGYPFVHVFTVHPGRRKIFYQTGSGPRSQMLQAQGLAYDLDDPSGIMPWVAREGKALIANDVSREPHYRPSELLPQETKAELAVPFVYGGEVLGLLDVQSDVKDVFDDDDLFLFSALADTISIAIHNATLFRSEIWRRQVADSLRDVAGLLSSNAGVERVLDAVLTELQRNLPSEIAAIWLLGDETPNLSPQAGQKLHLSAVSGADKVMLDKIRGIVPDAEHWLMRAMESDHPIIRPPQGKYGPLGAALGYPQDYSSLCAPLHISGRRFGVLAIAHPNPGRYGGEAARMTEAFASSAAVAIENARLYTSAQEQAWVSTVMLQVAEATQSLSNLDELLSTVVRLTPMLVNIKGCAVFLWDDCEESFNMASVYGIDPDQAADLGRAPILAGEALAFDQMRFGKTLVRIRDCYKELRLTYEIACKANGYNFVLLPLLARGEVLGALLVEQADQPIGGNNEEPFEGERLAVLTGIAQQTAVAVENIRLLEAKQEEAYVTAVLLQVAQAVVSLNDLDDILQAIVQIMPILVGIDNCIIYLWDKENEQFQPAQTQIGVSREQAPVLQRSFKTGEFPLLDYLREHDHFITCPLGSLPPTPDQWPSLQMPVLDADMDDNLQTTQEVVLGFPLSVQGVIYGALLAHESKSAVAFRERRIEIINGIAQQAAMAIQNDQLKHESLERERLEQEFQLARGIQQSFLPSHPPQVAGWDFDALWQPAREVGGDFYDVFPLPNHHLGLVIADVSDKGMPAALYMTVTRTLIRASAREEPSPAAVLMAVNNLLLMDAQDGMFVTAIYGILSTQTGRLIYANAGHNIPLVRRSKTGAVEPLEKGGMALGVLKDNPLSDHQLRIDAGDLLLFYTDGVTESFSPGGEQYGEVRLTELMRTCNIDTAHGLIQCIDRDLRGFTSSAPASDDITLMAFLRQFPRSKI